MKKKNNTIILATILILFGSATTFIAGYYTYSLVNPNGNSSSPQPSINPNATPDNTISEQQTTLLPDKHYFSDTIFVINKQAPHQTLIATVNRGEGLLKYTQNTRVSFYDGQNWQRELQDNSIENAAIFSNRIINKWNINIDPSRVLKEQINGTVTVKNQTIKFSTEELQNEMAMRSLPGYTKFQSRANGALTIANQTYPAYILYTRIYSLNASDIQFYDKPLGVTTEWIAFWSNNGDFYHIDKTKVERKTDIYQSHEIALKVDSENIVSKSFKVASSRDNDKDPATFNFTLGQPINESLQTKRLNFNNKSPLFTYVWQLAQIEGTVITSTGNKVSGFGISEYIKD